MLTKLRKGMHEYIDNFNKDMENISSKQKLKNTVTELKNMLENFNC